MGVLAALRGLRYRDVPELGLHRIRQLGLRQGLRSRLDWTRSTSPTSRPMVRSGSR